MALTTSGYALLSSALTLALVGVALGNFVLLVVAAFPLLLLVAATERDPEAPRIERRITGTRIRKGDDADVEIEVDLPPGLAFVEVRQPLPPEFVLTGGSNVHVLSCRPRERRRVSFHVRVRPTARGRVALPPVQFERVGLLGLEAPIAGEACGAAALDVVARTTGLAAGNARRGISRPAASAFDVSRLGAEGTEYKELRRYQWGDPPKHINWKATVRRMTPGARVTPLVNEYEREGKRTVFVLLDASERLDVGTSATTAFDHAVEAASGVAAHYLSRGYRVGAYAFNARRDGNRRAAEPVYPDVGAAHGERIRSALENARPGAVDEGLSAAVERCHGFLRQGFPLVVVVTRVVEPADALVEGVRRVRALLAGSVLRRAPVLVVSVRPYGLLVAEGPRAAEARVLLTELDAAAESAVAAAGARVVPWDPTRGGFAAAFLGRAPR